MFCYGVKIHWSNKAYCFCCSLNHHLLLPAKMLSSLALSIGIGLVLRLGMMIYGSWQDANMAVKYTDIDYHVFSDAAHYVAQGDSPYHRSTYRYTPLLAWILVPNTYFPAFGKVIFVLCDLLAAAIIYSLLTRQGCRHKTALTASHIWLFNPLAMTVSTRGNAESFIAVLVLGTIYLLSVQPYNTTSHMRFPRLIAAGAVYAVAVHTKIYPVTFALPIYLYLNRNYDGGEDKWSFSLLGKLHWDIWLNRPRILFGISAAAVFFTLTGVCYILYGNEFLQETYLYHITRRDTRHNFSPYFYMLYLTAEHPSSMLLGLLVFLPQLLLLIIVSCKYFDDLPLCTFLHTFIFVTFNKVCTSQYFLWYLCLLPLLLPYLNFTVFEATALLGIWFAGQAAWLLPAYYLEFEGVNSFLWIWLAGLLFFMVNVWILCRVVTTYRYQVLFDTKGKVLQKKSNNMDLITWFGYVTTTHKNR